MDTPTESPELSANTRALGRMNPDAVAASVTLMTRGAYAPESGEGGRSGLNSVRHRWLLAAALAAAATALVSTILVLVSRDGEDFARMSNRGTPIKVGDRERAMLSRPPSSSIDFTGEVLLLAIRGDRAFYRLPTRNGTPCYGVTVYRRQDGFRVGGFGCRRTPFPTREQPIWDESIIEATLTESTPHYWRVQGFAADGVETIGVADESDKFLARLPVRDNVYHLSHVPKGATRVLALNDEGEVVSRASALGSP
jgi:hypothetical protein